MYNCIRFSIPEGHRETPRASSRQAAIPPLRPRDGEIVFALDRTGSSHGRSSVGFRLAESTRIPEVKKSKTIRRKSTFRRVVKVSPSVVKVSWSVDFMSCSVDFVSCSVDFMSPLAPVLETRAFDITRDKSSRYGIRISGSRSKKGLFESQKPKKHPKNRFSSFRNCDLRRFGITFSFPIVATLVNCLR